MSNSDPKNSHQPPQEQAPSLRRKRSLANELDSLADEIERLTRRHDMPRRIELCRQALTLVERERSPKEWAWCHIVLASSLWQNPLGSRADDLEEAIDHYQQALELYTRQAYPEKWAMTQNNLAIAYHNRIKGQRRDNLEQAIHHYQQALEVRTRQAYPQEWAVIQNNLAIALKDRIRGERGDSLERAIWHYEQALEVRTRQAFPFQWARIQNNLANAYRNRIKGERSENLERAIAHLEQALEVRTRQAFPFQWARTQNNLAIAYADRIRGERGDNLERAILHYKQALEVTTRQAFPENWAMTQNNLAIAYSDRIRGERGDNLERAIWHYEQALEVRTRQSFPQKCRDTAYWLGHLLYGEERFSEARLAFVTAHEAVEALRGEVVREEAKRELAEENADLYARLVYCCLHEALTGMPARSTPNPSPTSPPVLGGIEGGRRGEHLAAAFEYAVAGKGRTFVDLLISTQFDFASLGAEEPALAADWRQARGLRQQIDQLLEKLNAKESTNEQQKSQTRELYRQLREQQAALSEHWQEMNWKYPILSATESAPTLSAAQACELAADVAATLVEYVRHAEGWGAFVINAEGLRYVPLPLVDDRLLTQMEKWVERLKGRWGRGKISYRPLRVWHEALIAPLGLPRPLAPSPTAPLVILAPFGRLHLLPLAALRAAENAPYLAAEYNLSFVPTLGALRALRDQERKDASMASDLQAPRLLSVAYPGTPPLPNVLPEAEAIMGYFAPHATDLHHAAATPQAVLQAAPGKQLIHLGCHGWFDKQHPTQSGLMLAGGWLTVQRIISELKLKQSSLTTLAACESGKSHVRSGEEYVGLTQALMTAGSKSVVASLWNINDNATRALFEAFYAQLTQGEAPVNALQHAQDALRQRNHWKHPYYWAAFTANGLAHQATILATRQATKPPSHHPTNLSEHLDQLNRASQQGGHLMNEEQIKTEATIILEQLIEYPADIQAVLNPSEAAILLEALNAISEQSHHAQNEADQLAIAHAIQTLAEELPPLRDLLLEEHTDIAKAQAERAITLQHHQKTAKGDKEAQAAMPGMTNDLMQARDALAKHLPDTQPVINQVTWRDRLWKKMGLK